MIRAALFQAWFFAVTAILGLAGIVVRLAFPHRALDFAKRWVRIVLWGARHIAGITWHTEGLAHLPQGPCLIASQHRAAFDTLIWMLLLPRPAYVMKAELLRIPLFGPMLTAAGMIPVNRQGGAAALRQLLRDAADSAQAGRQLIVFPEGTRVPSGATAPLQPGIAALATRLKLPVIPVVTNSGAVWGRGLHKRPGQIRIVIGPPLPQSPGRDTLLGAIAQAWARLEPELHTCG